MKWSYKILKFLTPWMFNNILLEFKPTRWLKYSKNTIWTPFYRNFNLNLLKSNGNSFFKLLKKIYKIYAQPVFQINQSIASFLNCAIMEKNSYDLQVYNW